MPVYARDLVDQARDFHPAFDRRQLPDKLVLRQLSRYQRRLAGKITALSEEALAVPVVFAKAEVDAAAVAGVTGPGLALPEYLLILSIFTRYTAGGPDIPVQLVAYSNNMAQALLDFPSAYLIRQSLYPVNRWRAGTAIKGEATGLTGWEELDGVSMIVVPVPPELVSLESEITLPAATHDALIAKTALWMASRQGVAPILPQLPSEAREAEEAAVMALGSQDTTSTWTVRRTT